MKKHSHPQDYDEEPVKYCPHCYSLKIKYEKAIDADCCMECGCPDIRQSSIEEWERLYERKYGHKYVSKQTDPRKTFFFNLPLPKIKVLVYNHPRLQEIIHTMYPKFPRDLLRIDAVLLLFDKLIKDNRLDELKLLLIKWNHKDNNQDNNNN